MKSLINAIYCELSLKKIKKMELFFNSPYFNQDLKQIKLQKFFSNNNNADIEKVSKHLKCDMNTEKSKLKKILAKHLELLRTFIKTENENSNNTLWIKSLINLNIENNQVLKETKKISKIIKLKEEVNSPQNYLEKFQISQFEINLFLKAKKLPINKLKTTFIKQNNSLDTFFLWNKLKILCFYYSIQSVFQMTKKIHLLKEVEEYMKENTDINNIAINLYWKIIQIRKNIDNVSMFDTVLTDIKSEKFNFINKDEQKEIYQYVIGICIIMIVRKNILKYNKTLFELYKTALANDMLVNSDGYISQRAFKNIIRSSLNNNEFNWAKKTIKQSKKYISPENYNDSFHYNSGVYFYFTKDYKKSLEHFSYLNYDNLYYAVDLRTFLLKLYYVTEEIDALFSLIDSFRAYLKRNKTFSTVVITSFRNFINGTKILANISPRDTKKLERLRNKVEKQNPVIEKKWLLNEISYKLNKKK